MHVFSFVLAAIFVSSHLALICFNKRKQTIIEFCKKLSHKICFNTFNKVEPLESNRQYAARDNAGVCGIASAPKFSKFINRQWREVHKVPYQ